MTHDDARYMGAGCSSRSRMAAQPSPAQPRRPRLLSSNFPRVILARASPAGTCPSCATKTPDDGHGGTPLLASPPLFVAPPPIVAAFPGERTKPTKPLVEL
ncbi:uncharacterized protein UV8b_00109 [Ustilaginoidea virens]|uniref:Uncharacterized protein n=1 Tax=Ustilaginoidea virens TaxID=1159556 RepID=A0A8E5HI69_USTVR|nr:uncharacterized protein UV8b_00109 [Ustilaginoidea virens]QUC15868.1 hypothetical protein UV8b_00109 [Ustilaginoidea virens]